jgi:hypothetical protein
MNYSIEIEDPQFLLALEQLLLKYQVVFSQKATEKDFVSEKRKQERAKIFQQFKGGLAKYTNSYTPTKNEWYEQ